MLELDIPQLHGIAADNELNLLDLIRNTGRKAASRIDANGKTHKGTYFLAKNCYTPSPRDLRQ